MTARTALTTLLNTAREWHAAVPALAEFCPWPDDLIWQDRAPAALPHIDHMLRNPGQTSDQSRAMRDALLAAVHHVEWRHTYTEAEVGRHFLDHFGWFELAGPTGHFLSNQARLTVGYWGPGLQYDWHHHAPEELYSVVSGSGLFRVEGEEDQVLGPGGTRFHGSNQRHALTTTDQPILTFVAWRGDGLADDPRMST